MDLLDKKRQNINYSVSKGIVAKGFNELEFEGEEFQVTKGCMYLSLLGRYSDAKLNNIFIEKKLGVSCTTRNWKTILKLNELIG